MAINQCIFINADDLSPKIYFCGDALYLKTNCRFSKPNKNGAGCNHQDITSEQLVICGNQDTQNSATSIAKITEKMFA